MDTTTTIKRSPIVLIRTLAIIEVCAFLAYSLATFLGNYKYEVYTHLFLASILSYNALKFLFLSGAQLVITVYGFLRWYYESYAIQSGNISHRKGVLFKKETSTLLESGMTATFSSGPLGRLLHYGTIRVTDARKLAAITLKDISHPNSLMKTVERAIRPEHNHEAPDIERLLSREEHESLEFKSSMRFDHQTAKTNRELEKVVMKTVAAFLNSRGGYVVLGVDDSRTPLGLEADYQTLPRKDSDGFEQHFTNVFNTMIGAEFRHFVKLWFHETNGHEICVASVMPSTRPVYVRTDNQEHFYVRTGNASTPLKLSRVETYTRSRWPTQES